MYIKVLLYLIKSIAVFSGSHEAAEYDESFERPMGYAVAGGNKLL